jgi:hypothetical protein
MVGIARRKCGDGVVITYCVECMYNKPQRKATNCATQPSTLGKQTCINNPPPFPASHYPSLFFISFALSSLGSVSPSSLIPPIKKRETKKKKMALIDILSPQLSQAWNDGTISVWVRLGVLASIPILWLALSTFASWRRLRGVPGPVSARFSYLWIFRTMYSGRMPEILSSLDEKYGPVIRIGRPTASRTGMPTCVSTPRATP